MKLWIASMECAGIIEAGGVKNVTYSLCKEFSALKHQVTLFIPVFKTTEYCNVKKLKKNVIADVRIYHCHKEEFVSYSVAESKDDNFSIVFINHPSFEQKEAVYTYTQNEQNQNPQFIKGTGHVDTLFMDSLFAKAVVEYANYVNKKEIPHIIHCQDASTALIPAFAKNKPILDKVKHVVTIHNAGPAYHHNFCDFNQAKWYTDFDDNTICSGFNDGKVEPFLLAVNAGAYLTTVSKDYADELLMIEKTNETEGLSKIFAEKQIPIKGITNGIDFERYDPSNKKISQLKYEYNPEILDLEGKFKNRNYFIKQINEKVEIPGIDIYGECDKNLKCVVSYHGRITAQKGIEILIKAIPPLLNTYDDLCFVICGQGELKFEEALKKLSQEYKGHVVFLNGYNRQFVRLANAIGDFLVLPSFFEPCGLEDFIGQIYGTIPIANKTGGLNKIIDNQTGFLYKCNTDLNLTAKLSQVISIKKYNPELLEKIIQNGVVNIKKNYLWSKVIKNEYLKFFKEILKNS